MEIILEILKYTLPAAVVFLTAYYILKTFLDNENKRRLLQMKMNNQKMTTPVRLQAYERVVLFLERISPGSIIMRMTKPGMTAFQLQTTLIQTIRDEFEHNLSQQLYISSSSWELTRNAKEEMIKMINLAASRLQDTATATDLSTLIFELSMGTEKLPLSKAIDYIKKEIRELF